MFSNAEAKRLLIESLARDAVAHEAARYQDVGRDFDAWEANLPRDGWPEGDQLSIALAFWDGWIDARNHQWQYYDGIKESDWPVLAREVIASLAGDREITEASVLRHFGVRAGRRREGRLQSLLERLRGE